MADIASDYIKGLPQATAFFAGSPVSVFDAERPPPGTIDKALQDAIAAHNAALGTKADLPQDAICIVTGQQPAIFGGPLYTVYKAITALELSERLERDSSRPYRAVFWSASEDHDFEEARSVHVLTKQHTPLELRFEIDANVTGLALSHVPMGGNIHELIDAAAAQTQGSEFRDDVRAFLHESANSSASLADWSERLIARLFEGTGLVFFRPDLLDARRMAAPVLKREIVEPLASTRLLNDAGARLESLGYQAQVVKGARECNFFLECDGIRCKALYEDGCFVLPETGRSYTRQDLLTILDSNPERFSQNVALRPIVQQRLFPAAAYIAGPGEIAYWAQLKPLFEHFETPMPIVYPRIRCALTNSKLSKLMARLGIDLATLDAPLEDIVERALQTTVNSEGLSALRAHRQRLLAETRSLQKALSREGSQGAAMALDLEAKLDHELSRIERALLHADEAQAASITQQAERIVHTLLPWRKPQERVYTPFSFAFDHGWDLVPRVRAALDPAVFDTQIVEL